VRVLFLSHRLPYAPNRGDRIRSYHMLQSMRVWADVDVISLAHDDEEADHAAEVERFAASVRTVRVPKVPNMVRAAIALASGRPLTHALLHSPDLRSAVASAVRANRPDVIFAYCTGIAPIVLEEPLRNIPLVLDMVDVDSAKWATLAASSAPPRSWIYAREARTLARFERTITRCARTTLVTTEAERETLARIAPGAAIEVVENGVDVDALRPPGPPVESATIVFCGVMNYPPNVDGAIWLAREVWPIVRRTRPDARLEIVGSNPARAVRALADPRADIVVTGAVPDVRPYLWGAAAAVAPLRTARGVQNKVLEAVAAGLPVVITQAVSVGLPVAVRGLCYTAEGRSDWAGALTRLLELRPASRQALIPPGIVHALRWSVRLRNLEGAVSRAGQSREASSDTRPA
jgi:sugar transferase (PEP-CTERM/EpsH1 system associated)